MSLFWFLECTAALRWQIATVSDQVSQKLRCSRLPDKKEGASPFKHSYLIAWVWNLAIAIAIGPLFVRSITKNYLCYLIPGWSIFWLVEIIQFEQQCCHLLIGPLLFFRFFEKPLIKIADEGNSICFVWKCSLLQTSWQKSCSNFSD